jgi:hypothetical protein
MFCAPELIFSGIDGVRSRFYVFRSLIHFWRYRGHLLPFSSFAQPDMFLVVRRASGPVLRSRTYFRRCEGRRLPFSCFALLNTFSAVRRASCPVFMFCALGLVFGGTEGVGSRYHVLRCQTRFRRYRGCPVPFSCFSRSCSFLAVRRASSLVFMFCAPGHVFGGAEGVGSRFHVLLFQTRFQRYRGRPVPFSCFARPDSFSVVTRASGPVFMFCAPEHVFGGVEGVESHFHVLRSRTHFRRCGGHRVPFSCFALPYSFSAVTWAWGPVFMFCAAGLVFGGNEGVVCRFHVLHSRTHFRQCGWRRVPFTCFALPDSFSVVPRASAPVLMICSDGFIFRGNEGDGSRFHILSSRTHFRRCGGIRVPFSCNSLFKEIFRIPSALS